jgi:hypothetical protein
MLQLRKLSNQRRCSIDQPSGIQMTLLDGHVTNSEINKNTLNVISVGTSSNANAAASTSNQLTLNPNLIANIQAGTQFEDAINSELNLEWIYKPCVQGIVRICAFCSFLSICANTPETFRKYPTVMVVSYAVDLISTIVLTIELIAKIKIRGLFRGDSAYIFDRWCQFDGVMVIFHIISVVLQVININNCFYFKIFIFS